MKTRVLEGGFPRQYRPPSVVEHLEPCWQRPGRPGGTGAFQKERKKKLHWPEFLEARAVLALNTSTEPLLPRGLSVTHFRFGFGRTGFLGPASLKL